MNLLQQTQNQEPATYPRGYASVFVLSLLRIFKGFQRICILSVTELAFLRSSVLVLMALFLSGCQMGYLLRNGIGQMKLLAAREDLEKALKRTDLSSEERHKLNLALEVRKFASENLGLKVEKIYTSYVKLDRPYVTWVVSASPKWELKSHEWRFPLVGRMPYKGFFTEEEAREEATHLEAQDLDTYVRGVSAYSTLGWFKDPILSSMIWMSDPDYVDTLIHELVHATLYIKNHADFNEQFAVFLGEKGMELFFKHKEGDDSPTLKSHQASSSDQRVFLDFIRGEIEKLSQWYKDLNTAERSVEVREAQFASIKEKFGREIRPQLQTKTFDRFQDAKLNNARLTLYKTYNQDLAVFEQAYEKFDRNFKAFLKAAENLKSSPDPFRDLAQLRP